MATIQQKLQTVKLPDVSGKEKVSPIGKVEYHLSNMHTVSVQLPSSTVSLVPGTGVQLSIANAFINLDGNWKVKYLRVIKDSGSFNLKVSGLAVSTTITVRSDETGRPAVSTVSCAATVGSVSVKFHGGASWLYNLFTKFIDKALRSSLQGKICPLVADAVSDLNPHLKTLNVLARVDQYAEIDYSMVSSPTVSKSSVNLDIKGEFYNIGKHQEPPFSPAVFSLPPENNNMLYIGLSVFTANSAGFVYNKAGVLSLYITDDMIPKSSPFRLSTASFGIFIPQVAKLFPGLLMKLMVKATANPLLTFEPNNATVQASGTVTAFAIQTNGTLSPLFILNLESSVSAKLFVSSSRLAGSVTLNNMNMTLGTSYVGDFKVTRLDAVFNMVLKTVVIPKVNAQLASGYPLPTIGQMKLVNTSLQVLKDYMLIATDAQFTS
ncbi:bactericidal permeability-increasing protein-like isoform X2 [Thalassophryne amazonica]|nr:bactericidal permeability-increasing protein-like isoform X2 [Thalassophryne amazonica]